MAQPVGKPDSAYSYDNEGFLELRAHIDGSIHNVVPKILQATIFYLSHYPVMEVHPGSRRMYDMIRTDLYLPHM